MSIRYYDDNAEAFFRDTVAADMTAIRARFLAHLKPGADILDAGCGSGRDARAFLEAGCRVTAFDGSAELARRASALTGLAVQHRSFETVDWEADFDGIWACASLLHVPRPDLAGVLRKLTRGLRPGGVFFLSFKEGTQDRQVKGRLFTDLTQTALAAFMLESGLAVLEQWTSRDVRPDRTDESWVSAIGRR